MDYKVEHSPTEPCWRVREISTGRLISTEDDDGTDYGPDDPNQPYVPLGDIPF